MSNVHPMFKDSHHESRAIEEYFMNQFSVDRYKDDHRTAKCVTDGAIAELEGTSMLYTETSKTDSTEFKYIRESEYTRLKRQVSEYRGTISRLEQRITDMRRNTPTVTQSDVNIARMRYEKAKYDRFKVTTFLLASVFVTFATFATGYNPLFALAIPMLVTAFISSFSHFDTNNSPFELRCEWIKLRDRYVEGLIGSIDD